MRKLLRWFSALLKYGGLAMELNNGVRLRDAFYDFIFDGFVPNSSLRGEDK